MKYKTDLVCYVRMTSWVGMSIGAVHFYAKLKFKDLKEVEVEHTLTKKEAKVLTKKDNAAIGYGSYEYEAGDTTGRFDSKEEVFACALEVFEEAGWKAKVLVVGNSSCLNPQECIWCIDKSKIEPLNELYEKLEKMYMQTDDPWDKFGNGVVERIFEDWWRIVNKLDKLK